MMGRVMDSFVVYTGNCFEIDVESADVISMTPVLIRNGNSA